MKRIDAHHHLWRYTPAEFDWISDDMRALRRDFHAADLQAEARAAGVTGTIAVQARQTLEETRFLLEAAAGCDLIQGVVGWLPLASPSLPQDLELLARDPLLRGVRHVAQGESDGFLLGEAFNQGVSLLAGYGLVYDLLIYAAQLPETIAFVDKHPSQPFVLDHIAKPGIRAGEIHTWARDLRALAARPNVSCKLSGMVTEADPEQWRSEQLRPYFEVVLEAFGPSRLMAGSDWPVLTVGCSYSDWWHLIESWIAELDAGEQQQILAGTAARAYGLADNEKPNAFCAEATGSDPKRQRAEI